ncbi:MAG: hypothetical protein AAGD00_07825 [Planctomycetota bacterium]
MSIVRTFRKLLRGEDGVHARAAWPSTAGETRLRVMSSLIAQLDRYGTASWATFTVEQPGDNQATLQVQSRAVNTLLEEIDVKRVLRDTGHTPLADACVTVDEGLHLFDDASADELAIVVDTLFQRHFKVPSDYGFSGWVES